MAPGQDLGVCWFLPHDILAWTSQLGLWFPPHPQRLGAPSVPLGGTPGSLTLLLALSFLVSVLEAGFFFLRPMWFTPNTWTCKETDAQRRRDVYPRPHSE